MASIVVPQARTGGKIAGKVTAAAAALVMVLLLITGARMAPSGAQGADAITVYGVSDWALADIPPNYLGLYQAAAKREGIDWAILAGIGSVETNHGRLQAPGVTAGANAYGCCGGPMQFYFTAGLHPGATGGQITQWGRVAVGQSSPATWGTMGGDGDGDGFKDVWDPDDAIPAAARYLKASGAPGDYQRAIFAYNRAQWYVDDVMRRAERYRGPKTTILGGGDATFDPLTTGPVSGDRLGRLVELMNQMDAARIPYCYGGGHGLTPARASGGQYCWGGTPLRKLYGSGDVGLDCSSSTSLLLQSIGYSLPTMTSGSFMSYGEPGPGRSVTIWTNVSHVYLQVTIAGRAYYFGTSTENYRHGPGWHSPRSGAGFVARHPVGL